LNYVIKAFGTIGKLKEAKKMKVGLYLRVSTLQQVDKESLSNQESRLKAYCKANGYQIYRIYKDAGVSAKDTKRPALESLLQDIRNKKIEAVIVTKLDRITRSLRDLIKLLELFQTYGVKFISISQNLDTTGSIGRFTVHLLGLVAQLERETTAERVAEDMYHRVLSDGKWNGGVIPFGYTTRQRVINELREKGVEENKIVEIANKIAPKPKQLYIDPKEAEIVKKIYQLYLEHKSLRKVTHLLNIENKTRKNGSWATTSVRRILTNPTYVGKIWYGKRKTDVITGKLTSTKRADWKIVNGKHKPIIQEELFNEVQEILEAKTLKPTRTSKVYLLSGILKCGKCGSRMHGYTYVKKINGKPTGKSYFYYKCHNHLSKGNAVCSGLNIPGKELEDYIVKTIMDLSKNKELLSDREKMLTTLKEEVKLKQAKTNKGLKKLQEEERKLENKKLLLLEKLENGVIDDETFKERFGHIRSLLEKNRTLQAELGKKSKEVDLSELAAKVSFKELADFGRNWDFLEPEGKKAKLHAIIKEIKITEDKIDIYIFVDEVCRKDRDSLPPLT
jgi:site-specific DNA recombinase